jgi:histidine kinase
VAPAHIRASAGVVPGYTITEEVYRGRRRIVYRGIRDRDGAGVVVKTLLDRSGGTESLSREYELIRTLDIDGVPRAIDLVRTGDWVALVLEDAGRQRLKASIPAGGMDTGAFLGFGLQLGEVLQALHERKVIHKDINPNNILSAVVR